MEFRNVLISHPARLSIRNNQLCIAQEQEVSVPIEDICTLMLESRQISISAAALETLAASGVTVFLCDRTHLPTAQLLAYNQHSRKKRLLFAQFELGKPLQKQLWQAIVRQKIRNQAACLRLAGRSGAEELEALAEAVRSGDSKNTEAVAAARYFPLLKDGYHMVQYSVYARICNGTDAVETHKLRLKAALPPKGAVRMIVVTEKQFNNIEILVGSPNFYDKPQQEEQLMEF